MTKVVLTNFGTTGEVYPVLALAQELSRQGCECRLALSPDYELWAKQLQLDFVPLGPSTRAFQRDQMRTVGRTPDLFQSKNRMIELWLPLKQVLPQCYDQLQAAVAGADILISGHLQPAARMVHETTGIPLVSLCATYLERSDAAPGVLVPISKSVAYQKATGWLINPLRERLGLRPLVDPLGADSLSGILVLFAISPHVVARPPNWPAHFHLTGYFRLEERYWRPSEELSKFLNSGEAPVVVSFGSMVLDDPAKATSAIIEAARLAKCRVIIQHGWSGLGSDHLPATVHLTNYAPHDWLFSRAACVIHHGGAGTSGAVFAAGVPSVFVPCAQDQPFWASRAEALGCAGSCLIPGVWDPEVIAGKIHEAVRNSSYHRAAKDLAAKLGEERGLRTARILIEDALQLHCRPN